MSDDYIAFDWGSTHLRAWRFQQGQCIDSCKLEAGITRLAGRHPRDIFQAVTAGWQAQKVPVIMAGMVGSNAGWHSVPYLSCPLTLNQLARHLTRIEDLAWIVPGVSVDDKGGLNIMRGEETQLLGAWQLAPSSLYIMPGTHCKWVQVEQGRLQRFKTVIAGELHHLLLNHSLIGTGLPSQATDRQAFITGLERGLQDGDILPLLFEVRAAYILGRLAQEAVSERLSGLLIGAEVAQMRRVYGSLTGQRVTIVGSPQLAARYQSALALSGITAEIVAGDTAFQQGIRCIANELAN